MLDEANHFSRYLTGRAPTPGQAEAYGRALATLGIAEDSAALAFARRHGWALGPLDAACALLRPGDDLRRRLLVMAAILETTPQGAADFMPRVASPARFAVEFLTLGIRATLRTAAGLALWPWVRRGATGGRGADGAR